MASVKVAARVRPLFPREIQQDATNIVGVNENTIALTNIKVTETDGDRSRDRVRYFVFDYAYLSADRNSPGYASQELIFQDLGTEVLDAAFEGYNACVFAYGQTGSGKSYTMMGKQMELGLIPRICEGLCSRVDDFLEEGITFKIEVSYLEIYNERVRDLLHAHKKHTYTLKVREHPLEGPYVQDLSWHTVSDLAAVQMLIDKGNANRTTAATHMHDASSRSHAIFTLNFTQAKLEDNLPSEIVSKINLVDLAGCERADPRYSRGRLLEGASINKSLVTLGNVISALAENSLSTSTSVESFSSIGGSDEDSSPRSLSGRRKHTYIPYRNSVLTWLLKDSLGGNAKTIMVATISPASHHFNETLSTLRYAKRAKHIVNKPVINEDSNVTLIRDLRAEIDKLKSMLERANMRGSQTSLAGDGSIFEMLHKNEEKVEELTSAWVGKWTEAAAIMQECNVGIRRSNVGVIVESELPHLIGMDDDLLSTGIILYHLKEGETKIGREDSAIPKDIVLRGPGLEAEHCTIVNNNGVVTLFPNEGSLCAVNGIDVTTETQLTQGAVILLGKTNMFRFNHPAQAAKLRERRQSSLFTIKTAPDLPQTITKVTSSSDDRQLSLSAAGASKSCNVSTSSIPSLTPEDLPDDSLPARSPVSPVMMFNPQLEIEMQQKKETDRLEETRRKVDELKQEQREAEEAYAIRQEEMERMRQIWQTEIQREKQILERLKQQSDFAKQKHEQELEQMKQKLEQQKLAGERRLSSELRTLKDVASGDTKALGVQTDLMLSQVLQASEVNIEELDTLEVGKKRIANIELLQNQSVKRAEESIQKRQKKFEKQERASKERIKRAEKHLKKIESAKQDYLRKHNSREQLRPSNLQGISSVKTFTKSSRAVSGQSDSDSHSSKAMSDKEGLTAMKTGAKPKRMLQPTWPPQRDSKARTNRSADCSPARKSPRTTQATGVYSRLYPSYEGEKFKFLRRSVRDNKSGNVDFSHVRARVRLQAKDGNHGSRQIFPLPNSAGHLSHNSDGSSRPWVRKAGDSPGRPSSKTKDKTVIPRSRKLDARLKGMAVSSSMVDIACQTSTNDLVLQRSRSLSPTSFTRDVGIDVSPLDVDARLETEPVENATEAGLVKTPSSLKRSRQNATRDKGQSKKSGTTDSEIQRGSSKSTESDDSKPAKNSQGKVRKPFIRPMRKSRHTTSGSDDFEVEWKLTRSQEQLLQGESDESSLSPVRGQSFEDIPAFHTRLPLEKLPGIKPRGFYESADSIFDNGELNSSQSTDPYPNDSQQGDDRSLEELSEGEVDSLEDENEPISKRPRGGKYIPAGDPYPFTNADMGPFSPHEGCESVDSAVGLMATNEFLFDKPQGLFRNPLDETEILMYRDKDGNIKVGDPRFSTPVDSLDGSDVFKTSGARSEMSADSIEGSQIISDESLPSSPREKSEEGKAAFEGYFQNMTSKIQLLTNQHDDVGLDPYHTSADDRVFVSIPVNEPVSKDHGKGVASSTIMRVSQMKTPLSKQSAQLKGRINVTVDNEVPKGTGVAQNESVVGLSLKHKEHQESHIIALEYPEYSSTKHSTIALIKDNRGRCDVGLDTSQEIHETKYGEGSLSEDTISPTFPRSISHSLPAGGIEQLSYSEETGQVYLTDTHGLQKETDMPESNKEGLSIPIIMYEDASEEEPEDSEHLQFEGESSIEMQPSYESESPQTVGDDTDLLSSNIDTDTSIDTITTDTSVETVISVNIQQNEGDLPLESVPDVEEEAGRDEVLEVTDGNVNPNDFIDLQDICEDQPGESTQQTTISDSGSTEEAFTDIPKISEPEMIDTRAINVMEASVDDNSRLDLVPAVKTKEMFEYMQDHEPTSCNTEDITNKTVLEELSACFPAEQVIHKENDDDNSQCVSSVKSQTVKNMEANEQDIDYKFVLLPNSGDLGDAAAVQMPQSKPGDKRTRFGKLENASVGQVQYVAVDASDDDIGENTYDGTEDQDSTSSSESGVTPPKKSKYREDHGVIPPDDMSSSVLKKLNTSTSEQGDDDKHSDRNQEELPSSQTMLLSKVRIHSAEHSSSDGESSDDDSSCSVDSLTTSTDNGSYVVEDQSSDEDRLGVLEEESGEYTDSSESTCDGSGKENSFKQHIESMTISPERKTDKNVREIEDVDTGIVELKAEKEIPEGDSNYSVFDGEKTPTMPVPTIEEQHLTERQRTDEDVKIPADQTDQVSDSVTENIDTESAQHVAEFMEKPSSVESTRDSEEVESSADADNPETPCVEIRHTPQDEGHNVAIREDDESGTSPENPSKETNETNGYSDTHIDDLKNTQKSHMGNNNQNTLFPPDQHNEVTNFLKFEQDSSEPASTETLPEVSTSPPVQMDFDDHSGANNTFQLSAQDIAETEAGENRTGEKFVILTPEIQVVSSKEVHDIKVRDLSVERNPPYGDITHDEDSVGNIPGRESENISPLTYEPIDIVKMDVDMDRSVQLKGTPDDNDDITGDKVVATEQETQQRKSLLRCHLKESPKMPPHGRLDENLDSPSEDVSLSIQMPFECTSGQDSMDGSDNFKSQSPVEITFPSIAATKSTSHDTADNEESRSEATTPTPLKAHETGIQTVCKLVESEVISTDNRDNANNFLQTDRNPEQRQENSDETIFHLDGNSFTIQEQYPEEIPISKEATESTSHNDNSDLAEVIEDMKDDLTEDDIAELKRLSEISSNEMTDDEDIGCRGSFDEAGDSGIGQSDVEAVPCIEPTQHDVARGALFPEVVYQASQLNKSNPSSPLKEIVPQVQDAEVLSVEQVFPCTTETETTEALDGDYIEKALLPTEITIPEENQHQYNCRDENQDEKITKKGAIQTVKDSEEQFSPTFKGVKPQLIISGQDNSTNTSEPCEGNYRECDSYASTLHEEHPTVYPDHYFIPIRETSECQIHAYEHGTVNVGDHSKIAKVPPKTVIEIDAKQTHDHLAMEIPTCEVPSEQVFVEEPTTVDHVVLARKSALVKEIQEAALKEGNGPISPKNIHKGDQEKEWHHQPTDTGTDKTKGQSQQSQSQQQASANQMTPLSPRRAASSNGHSTGAGDGDDEDDKKNRDIYKRKGSHEADASPQRGIRSQKYSFAQEKVIEEGEITSTKHTTDEKKLIHTISTEKHQVSHVELKASVVNKTVTVEINPATVVKQVTLGRRATVMRELQERFTTKTTEKVSRKFTIKSPSVSPKVPSRVFSFPEGKENIEAQPEKLTPGVIMVHGHQPWFQSVESSQKPALLTLSEPSKSSGKMREKVLKQDSFGSEDGDTPMLKEQNGDKARHKDLKKLVDVGSADGTVKRDDTAVLPKEQLTMQQDVEIIEKQQQSPHDTETVTMGTKGDLKTAVGREIPIVTVSMEIDSSSGSPKSECDEIMDEVADAKETALIPTVLSEKLEEVLDQSSLSQTDANSLDMNTEEIMPQGLGLHTETTVVSLQATKVDQIPAESEMPVSNISSDIEVADTFAAPLTVEVPKHKKIKLDTSFTVDDNHHGRQSELHDAEDTTASDQSSSDTTYLPMEKNGNGKSIAIETHSDLSSHDILDEQYSLEAEALPTIGTLEDLFGSGKTDELSCDHREETFQEETKENGLTIGDMIKEVNEETEPSQDSPKIFSPGQATSEGDKTMTSTSSPPVSKHTSEDFCQSCIETPSPLYVADVRSIDKEDKSKLETVDTADLEQGHGNANDSSTLPLRRGMSTDAKTHQELVQHQSEEAALDMKTVPSLAFDVEYVMLQKVPRIYSEEIVKSPEIRSIFEQVLSDLDESLPAVSVDDITPNIGQRDHQALQKESVNVQNLMTEKEESVQLQPFEVCGNISYHKDATPEEAEASEGYKIHGTGDADMFSSEKCIAEQAGQFIKSPCKEHKEEDSSPSVPEKQGEKTDNKMEIQDDHDFDKLLSNKVDVSKVDTEQITQKESEREIEDQSNLEERKKISRVPSFTLEDTKKRKRSKTEKADITKEISEEIYPSSDSSLQSPDGKSPASESSSDDSYNLSDSDGELYTKERMLVDIHEQGDQELANLEIPSEKDSDTKDGDDKENVEQESKVQEEEANSEESGDAEIQPLQGIYTKVENLSVEHATDASLPSQHKLQGDEEEESHREPDSLATSTDETSNSDKDEAEEHFKEICYVDGQPQLDETQTKTKNFIDIPTSSVNTNRMKKERFSNIQNTLAIMLNLSIKMKQLCLNYNMPLVCSPVLYSLKRLTEMKHYR
ncbi:uncharacterized protein [Ptychodera flava]|uniref:uncharacterized protein isoform X2 n=1 Tax=Ptychodera flava TaxID=63121 RepID=UPI003969BC3A